MKYLVKFIFVLLFFSSCITRLPTRVEIDGNSYLNEETKTSLLNFETEQAFEKKAFSNSNEIKFFETTSENLNDILIKSDKTWVIIWAPWCPYCITNLKNYVDRARKDNIKLLLISSTYDIKNNQKFLYENNYGFNGFLLSSKKYGDNQNERIKKFRNEICTDCNDDSIAVPQHYFYKGNILVGSFIGGKINNEELKAFTNK